MRYLVALVFAAAIAASPFLLARYGIDAGTFALLVIALFPVALLSVRVRFQRQLAGLKEVQGGFHRSTLATVNRVTRGRAGMHTVYTFTPSEGGRFTSKRPTKYALFDAQKGDHVEVIYLPSDPAIHTFRDAIDDDIHRKELDIRSLRIVIPCSLLFVLICVGARVAHMKGWL